MCSAPAALSLPEAHWSYDMALCQWPLKKLIRHKTKGTVFLETSSCLKASWLESRVRGTVDFYDEMRHWHGCYLSYSCMMKGRWIGKFADDRELQNWGRPQATVPNSSRGNSVSINKKPCTEGRTSKQTQPSCITVCSKYAIMERVISLSAVTQKC